MCAFLFLPYKLENTNFQVNSSSSVVSVTWKVAYNNETCSDYQTSPEFEFNKQTWFLKFFKDSRRNSVALDLHSNAIQTILDVFFKFGMRDPNGQLYCAFEGRERFGAHNSSGLHTIISTAVLECRAKELMPQNILTLFCELRNGACAPKESVNIDCATLTRTSYTDILAADLGSLLKERRHCDLTLHLGDEVFQAHKIILETRSSVFSAMFEHDMKESRSNEVTIKDIRPQDFGVVLDYIYSGNVGELSIEQALGVYSAADKYDLKVLKSHCRNALLEKLCEDWFFEIGVLADAHNDGKLMDGVKHFALHNVSSLLFSDKCADFFRDHPVLAVEVLRSGASAFKAKD